MNNIGLDLGYSAIKMAHAKGQITFPSIVGTPEESNFRLTGSGSNSLVIEYEGKEYNVGQSAIDQSRFMFRQEDRNWFNSMEYMVLFHAALSHLQDSGGITINIITGLPVAFYKSDKGQLKEKLEGVHRVLCNKRDALTVNVSKVHVIPQVMGALLNIALNDEGDIADITAAKERIGVIDIGGKTTNLLHAHKMGDIARETTSVNIGGWDMVRAIRPAIESLCPDVEYSDHEIANAVAVSEVDYGGKSIDLTESIEDVLVPMAESIVTKAKTLWPGNGAKLKKIFLSGGGALLIGNRLIELIGHNNIEIVKDSVFANAKGYYKVGLFEANKES